MNFLQGVQRLGLECGVADGITPVTVVGQTGELLRLVNWYKQALVEMQLEREDFDFLRTEHSFTTTAEKQKYTLAEIGLTDHASWSPDTFRIYKTTSGRNAEVFLTQHPYQAFRDIYLYGSNLTAYSQPIAYCIGPDDSVYLALPPDDTYTVICEYFKTPVEVSADTDTPVIPARLHLGIVFKAMMYYGAFEAAGEVYSRGETGYNMYLSKLKESDTQQISMSGSLI